MASSANSCRCNAIASRLIIASGHVRISAFNSRENVEKALTRIAAALKQ